MTGYTYFIVTTALLSVISLFIEQSDLNISILLIAGQAIDYILMAAVLFETVAEIASEKYRRRYFRKNWPSFSFTIIFTLLFCYSKFLHRRLASSSIAVLAVMLRNLFAWLRMYSRIKRLRGYVEKMTTNPAQTILASFAAVIFTGALLLMMGFSTKDGKGLSFLSSFFTATSCVCVTGLTVVDTVSTFSLWGQIILLALIQIGGLGIMLLSYFTIYIIRKRVSLADKMMLSYMLSEDAAGIYKSMTNIVGTTFVIEMCGAALLFFGFAPVMGFSIKTAWFSLFHAVSSFCNAGFSLFETSLEIFRDNPFVILTISVLVILGGIGFSCIANLRDVVSSALLKKHTGKNIRLELNTKVVIIGTFVLLLSGMLIFYILEYDNTMRDYSLGEQYLASFFQAVTFRTAGFNSVPFNNLRRATYIIFCLYMTIGAASGSTAGGMKINTIAVLISVLYSYLHGTKHYRIGKTEIANEKVLQSCIIFIVDVLCIIIAVIAISLCEGSSLDRIFFEVSSALGTAGVTSGLTPALSVFSKLVLIVLMFWGRVGALTILSAAPHDDYDTKIRWPQADISIG